MVPYIASFQYWIMDILFKYQSTVRSMQIKMLRLLKESILFFNKFELTLVCFVPKMKKVVINILNKNL